MLIVVVVTGKGFEVTVMLMMTHGSIVTVNAIVFEIDG